MATISVLEPQYVGSGDFQSPVILPYLPAPGAAWRKGDLLVTATTGTISTWAPAGALAANAGPIASAITFGSAASTGAPGGTYYFILTYTATSTESLPSAEYAVNVLPGFVPTVSVSAAGAPAAATNFAAYVALSPGFEALQQATKTTTALGATFSVANPLTNYVGAARAATNASGSIIGLANQDSNEVFFSGAGGSAGVGNQSLFGATMSLPPLQLAEVQLCYVTKLQGGAIIEISLRQTVMWTPTLLAAGTQVGLYLDASGFFTVDPSQSNKVAQIVADVAGVPSLVGTTGDYGHRVQVQFLSSVLV